MPSSHMLCKQVEDKHGHRNVLDQLTRIARSAVIHYNGNPLDQAYTAHTLPPASTIYCNNFQYDIVLKPIHDSQRASRAQSREHQYNHYKLTLHMSRGGIPTASGASEVFSL